MRPGYTLAIVFMLLCGWRAWIILRNAQPLWRSVGTVFSTLAPVPVFLIVVVYHYADKLAGRRVPASSIGAESTHG